MAGRKTYPDLKYLFMRGLIEHERQQRTRHYLKSAAECTSRAIVSLELSDESVRSVSQARQLEGIGGETCAKLTKLEKERSFSNLKPIGGQFVSSAGAILVALLDATDDELFKGHSQDRPVLIIENHVRRRAFNLSEELFVEQNGIGEGFCKAWWRLEVLIKRGLIRRRSYKKEAVLQLLPLGRDIAMRLRGATGITSMPPSQPVQSIPSSSSLHKQSQWKIDNTRSTEPWEIQGDQSVKLDDALYTNDDGKDGIVMLVDTQEWGGDRVGLGNLCQLLEQAKICYKTRRLATGDYGWFCRVDGIERTLPCLIERKRADDVARTLKEGRFWSQVKKMVAWKKDFTSRGVDCSLHYILEREPEDYVVQCADGCQGVGKCGNPTLRQVKLAIEDLKRHPDLQVKSTDSVEVTVVLLASFTADLIDRASKGDFDEIIVQDMTKDNSSKTHIEHSSEQLNNLKGDKSRMSTMLVDLDDELQQVLQESAKEMKNEFKIDKHETRIIDTDFTKEEKGFNNNPITLRMEKTESSFVHSELNTLDTLHKSDSDIDEDLAQAIENSKTDTRYCETDDRLQDSSMPLMQYHCSLTKSVTCSTKSPQKKNVNANEYRPKINRNNRSDLSKTPERHKTVDYLNKDINSLTSIPGKTGNLPEKGMQRTTESLQSMTTYSRLHNLSRQAKEALCKTDTLNSDRTIPYPDVNYNISSNRIDANSNNTSMFKTSQSILQDDQNNTNPGYDKCIPVKKNHKTNLNLIQDKSNIEQHVMDKIEHSNWKKRRMRLNINPDESNIERNVINVDTNRNIVKSRISEHTARPTNFGSIDIELPKNDATDTVAIYNSDEDLFNESPALAYTRKSRELDKSEVNNEKQFEAEIESDPSSLDSLPEIEFLPRGEEKFSSPLVRNSISRNLIEESSRISPTSFPDVSVNLAIHASDSRKNNSSKYLSGPKEESYDLSIIHQNQRYVNANEITQSTMVDRLHEGPRTKQTKRKNNNYSIANDNDIHEKIDQIITVLPQLDRERCFWLLHKFLGNVERCIEHILLEENQSNPGEVINLDD